MHCKSCGRGMVLQFVNDNPNEGFAYNVYECAPCGVVCKEDVWANAGVTWLMSDGTSMREAKALP